MENLMCPLVASALKSCHEKWLSSYFFIGKSACLALFINFCIYTSEHLQGSCLRILVILRHRVSLSEFEVIGTFRLQVDQRLRLPWCRINFDLMLAEVQLASLGSFMLLKVSQCTVTQFKFKRTLVFALVKFFTYCRTLLCICFERGIYSSLIRIKFYRNIKAKQDSNFIKNSEFLYIRVVILLVD